MICFPNAKINIGLNILDKRPDNFHNIQTIFYPVGLSDALEVVAVENIANDYEFSNTGLVIDSPIEKNLVVKAYLLLKNDYNLPKVKIHLHKVIPFGAGMGGGSSDAAFMLVLLNNIFSLRITNEKLKHYAAELGADCAFFIDNKPSFATQKGEVLEQIEIDLSNYQIVIAKPQVNVPTKNVYSLITPNSNVSSLKDLIKLPLSEWKNNITNDFEAQIFKIHKEIAEIKEKFYEQGAIYSSMTGSGSAVFAIFEKNLHVDFSEMPIIYKS